MARAAALALGLSVSVLCGEAMAQEGAAELLNVRRVTPGEMVRLPEYCPHTQPYAKDPTQARAWSARLGSTFSHLHHYCWALLKAMRAETLLDPQARTPLYQSAIEECVYVLERAPDGFVLTPEILYRMGTFAAAKRDFMSAFGYFERSRAAKADYWPPYVEEANINLKLGRRQRALEIVNAGLQVMPEEPQLLELRRKSSDGRAAAPAPRRPAASSSR